MKVPGTYVVQHHLNGEAPIRVTKPYSSRRNAEREAIAYTEKLSRLSGVGMVIEVANGAGVILWSARIVARYQIELMPV